MPRSEHDLDADTSAALARIMDTLRRMLGHAVRVDGSAHELGAVADQLAEAEASLRRLTGRRAVDRYLPFADGDVNGMLPYSPVSGRLNPMAPPLHLEIRGERMHGRVTFGPAYEGPPDCVHGAWVAAAYDQILALVNVAGDVGGPTASLTVSYRRPTPLATELHFEAWTESVDDRKVVSKGRCFAGDQLVSEAEGLFVRLDPTKATRIWKQPND